MFIKFSDKTKKIIIKETKDNEENEDENVVYLDENDDKNYRIKIIKNSLNKKNK